MPIPIRTGKARGLENVLILAFSDLANDPRASRQVELLANLYSVTAAGFTKPASAGVNYVRLLSLRRSLPQRVLAVALLQLHLFERFYWASPTIRHAIGELTGREFDLILANDLTALPLACALKPRFGVIFDAHEYSPRELEDRLFWRLLYQRYNHYLCRRYLPATAGMFTVCKSIASAYQSTYGVSPEVLLSTPPYQDLRPRPTAATTIRLVHHGGAIPSRKIELMVNAMGYVDERFQLDLMLVPGDVAYLRHLEALAARTPRVQVIAPVAMQELPRKLNEYDIGLFLLPPVNFNYRYALPNKFFEFIQGRLGLAIGPSPEMAQLVQKYGCGIVMDDFKPRSLAQRLNKLDHQQIDRLKQRSHEAARDLCFEKNAPVLLNMINKIAARA